MTDVLTDTDLLSDNEKAPTPAKEEAPKDAGLPCPHCSKTFPGGFAGARRNAHIKKDHPEHWTGAVGMKSKGTTKKATGTTKAAAPRQPSTPKPAGRKPLGASFAMIVDNAAPVAAVMGEWEVAGVLGSPGYAPALGAAIDDVIADTALDKRVLQPLAGKQDKYGTLAMVGAFPFIVRAMSRNEALHDALMPAARACVESMLVKAAPLIKERIKRQQQATQALAELGALDPSLAAEADPVGSLIEGFLTPPDGYYQPAPAAEEAGEQAE